MPTGPDPVPWRSPAAREARTAADLRAAWAVVRELWERTVTEIPAELVDVGVGGEWSPAQTLRHVVVAVDVWLGRVRTTVHRCLLVVLREHVDHRRCALRDLATATGG